MQMDFHYYATYCAAFIAGFTHEQSKDIAYSAEFVDHCSKTFLSGIKAPQAAATTQLSLEMMEARTDLLGLQDITRIWASFHFLPYDLYAKKRGCSKAYLDKYRLICNVNGPLVKETVDLARDKGVQGFGMAMHILADTWAHRYFAGTPSLVINNTNSFFYELIPEEEGFKEAVISFRHTPKKPDDLENRRFTNTLFQSRENAIMNLGHGRAGHLPDYSFIRYKYLPAWGDYQEVIKDNPAEYLSAFCQMIYALKCLRNKTEFLTDRYDRKAAEPWGKEIFTILEQRRRNAKADWKRLGEKLSGNEIPDFSIQTYQQEYMDAEGTEKNETFLGRFIAAAMAQKSMVTSRIYASKNMLAGLSADYSKQGMDSLRDFARIVMRVNHD